MVLREPCRPASLQSPSPARRKRSGRAASRWRASCSRKDYWRRGRQRPSRYCRSPTNRHTAISDRPCGPALARLSSAFGSIAPKAEKPRIASGKISNASIAELHFPGFDLLAEIFRRAADHQTCDEHCDDGEHEHAVKARTGAARQHFAELDHQQRNESAQRRERIVHRVDSAARQAGGDGGVKRRHRGAKRTSLPSMLPTP